MPTTIEARYKAVTPLFCAGASPNRPELRLPSFKGVLRFWWRALAWSRYGGDLAAIRREEDSLFGSADGGQSRVSMRLAEAAPTLKTIQVDEVLKVPGSKQVVGPGARYLGYGVMEAFKGKRTKAGRLTRACLQAPFEFTVGMRVRNLEPPALESVEHALIALGTLGGMGAKSRKGYGSLVLQSLRVDDVNLWRCPSTVEELRDTIASIAGGWMDGTTSFPQYTALSARTRHLVLTGNSRNPVELLNLVGCELVRYRSWGRNGKVLDGEPREGRFKVDHDLMKRARWERRTHPLRIAFGLPHNYGRNKDQQVGPLDKQLDRRASPLFLHIHECGKIPVAVVSFLPARFLPEGRSAISVGGTRVRQLPERDLFRPIDKFLDRLLDPGERKAPFANVVEVMR